MFTPAAEIIYLLKFRLLEFLNIDMFLRTIFSNARDFLCCLTCGYTNLHFSNENGPSHFLTVNDLIDNLNLNFYVPTYYKNLKNGFSVIKICL